MKSIIITPIIFALMGWTHVSAQDSSDPIAVPANEVLTFSASLNVSQCEVSNEISHCSTSLPFGQNQILLLEPDFSSCDYDEGRPDLHPKCKPSLRGEWLKSKRVDGRRYIGIIYVQKVRSLVDGVGEYFHYYIEVEILYNGKTVAKMSTQIANWSDLPSVTLVAPSIEKTTLNGIFTTTLSLNIGPQGNTLEPIPIEKSPLLSRISDTPNGSKGVWKLIKGQLR